jgi:hypothetical protein
MSCSNSNSTRHNSNNSPNNNKFLPLNNSNHLLMLNKYRPRLGFTPTPMAPCKDLFNRMKFVIGGHKVILKTTFPLVVPLRVHFFH